MIAFTPDNLDDILGDIDDNEFDRARASIIRFADSLSEDDVIKIRNAADVADSWSTISGPAVMIRDTLRDNTSFMLIW